MLGGFSVAEISIDIHGITLRERVSEAGDCAEGKAENSAQRLLGPVFLGHVVDCCPHEATDAEKEEQVSSPLDDFPDAVAERLVVAAEDSSASGSLGHRADGRQRKDRDHGKQRRECIKNDACLNQPAAGTSCA